MTRPKKSLGQNFLVDRGVASRIVASVGPESGDAIIEVGPGKGALTRQLVERAGYVVGVEIDRDLAAGLGKAIPTSNLSLIVGDIVATDWRELISSTVTSWQRVNATDAKPRVRIVANLPYYISTAVIQDLMDHCGDLFDITLMLQLEVVERIVSGPGSRDYGYLTVLVSYHCEAVKLFKVAPGAFLPVPKVWSAVMRLRPHANLPVVVADKERFFSLVRAAFAHRRKTIANNLKGWSETRGEPRLIAAALEQSAIDPKRRAETLSITEFAALYEAIGRSQKE